MPRTACPTTDWRTPRSCAAGRLISVRAARSLTVVAGPRRRAVTSSPAATARMRSISHSRRQVNDSSPAQFIAARDSRKGAESTFSSRLRPSRRPALCA